MEIYEINDEGLTRIRETALEREATLEDHLLRADGAQIGGTELFYIDRQGAPDTGGRFDILALDRTGRCVVVELKREKTPRDIVAQALEYASGIQEESYDGLEQRYRDFAGNHQAENSLAGAHQASQRTVAYPTS